MTSERTLYSAIIPVCTRVDNLAALIDEYADALKDAGIEFEVIAVLDGLKSKLMNELDESSKTRDWLRIIQFSRSFGEAAALTAGFNEARGEVLLTLPAYWQVDPSEIPALIKAAGDHDDMLLAVRSPRTDASFDRIRRRVFHGLLTFTTGYRFHDLGCGVRLLNADVAREISLYGDQHRFMPALADRRGFRVREVELAQSPNDRFRGRYKIREYLHRILDLLTVFFLVRFTKKPLRFFGSLGFIAAGFGGITVLVLIVQRLLYGMALADRPALLLGSLMIVLGVQLFAIGLLGELVIFSHGTASKEYAIRSITEGQQSIRVSPEPLDESREIAAES